MLTVSVAGLIRLISSALTFKVFALYNLFTSAVFVFLFSTLPYLDDNELRTDLIDEMVDLFFFCKSLISSVSSDSAESLSISSTLSFSSSSDDSVSVTLSC